MIAPGVKKPGPTAPELDRALNAAVQTSRTIAARQAGISEKRQATALQVANVPEDEFEAAVETDKPATVKALAKRGRKSRRLNAREAIEDDAGTGIKDEEPDNYEAAFLLRTDHASRAATDAAVLMRSYPPTKKLAAAARRVAAKWTQLADAMEKPRG